LFLITEPVPARPPIIPEPVPPRVSAKLPNVPEATERLAEVGANVAAPVNASGPRASEYPLLPVTVRVFAPILAAPRLRMLLLPVAVA